MRGAWACRQKSGKMARYFTYRMYAVMTEQTNAILEDDLTRMVAVAINALEDVKAKDITLIDTTQKTSLFARMIVASGDSSRQIKALANNVAVDLKQNGFELLGSEGEDGGEWVLVDAGELVVHVMLPAVREFYDLETLWGGVRPNSVQSPL